MSIHPDRLLIVEAVVRHLLRPQNLIRIIQDPICGEFVLCRTGQEVDILYRYNMFVDGDVVIFTMVHYLWLLGPHQPIEYLSNCLPIRHCLRISETFMLMKFICTDEASGLVCMSTA
jgi:hypothetical protein